MDDELHQHVRALRRYALVLCRDRDEAEDLVQETLLRALNAAGSYDRERELRVWLFTILHNAYVSRLRRRRLLPTPPETEGAVPPAQVAYVELRETLDALQRLPEEQRMAVVLVGLEALSYAEAARILQIPIGTLMSRLSRGREGLRRMMDGATAPAAAIGHTKARRTGNGT